MSKLSDEFTLDLAPDGASLACKRAIASTGWDIVELEPNRIKLKVAGALSVSREPCSIVVHISGNDGQSAIRLDGWNWGVDAWKRKQLQGTMNKLHNAIEVAGATPQHALD